MELKIEQVDVSLIKPYERNIMKHPHSQIEELAKMMKEYGFLNPILLDSDYNIVAGHGRYEAGILNGMKTIPSMFVAHLSERQIKAFRIADNKISRKSKFDMEFLAEELGALSNMDFDLTMTGFDEQEIDSLLKQDLSFLPNSDNYETRKVAFEVKVKPKEKPQVFSIVKVICPTEQSEEKLNGILEKEGFQTA